jgi:iron complex transport system substrate-binding protein
LKNFSILKWVIVTLVLVAGCDNNVNSDIKIISDLNRTEASSFPLEITDGYGKTIVLKTSPQKIIVIDSAAVEILYDLGAQDRILATHDFVNYPPLSIDIPRVGNAFALDYEKIVSLEPDLIYIFFDGPYQDLVALDVPVLYIKSPTSLKGVAERIQLWGKILNKQNTANEVADEFLQSLNEVTSKLSDIESFSMIYHDVSPGWWTSGSGTLANEIFTTVKAKNIFDDISGWSQVSVEQIVSRNPQFIISVYPEGHEMLLNTDALQSVDAISNQKILTIESDLLAIEGPRLVQGMISIAEFLYPDIYR